MPGNKIGGQAAARNNKLRWGSDFYVRLGQRGGSAFHAKPRGFAANRDLAVVAGQLGGAISRRGGLKLSELERLKVRKAYEELMKIHRKAQRERGTEEYAQPVAPRVDEGAVTVFDRKRGLVRDGQAA